MPLCCWIFPWLRRERAGAPIQIQNVAIIRDAPDVPVLSRKSDIACSGDDLIWLEDLVESHVPRRRQPKETGVMSELDGNIPPYDPWVKRFTTGKTSIRAGRREADFCTGSGCE
jgi:hypothetical protein